MRGRTCGTCGSHWRDGTARWCGHCGAPLPPTRPPPGGGRGHRRVTAGVAASGAVLALLVLPDGRAVLAPPAPTPVVLPDRPPPPPSRGDPERATLRCRTSAACTEITTASAHRGPFLGAATDDVLVLAEGPGLSGYDLDAGDRRWRLDLDIDPMQPVPRLAAVRGDAAVVAAVATGELLAVDAATGRRLWTRSAPGVEDVFAVRARADHWRATVRVRHDNRSSVAHLDLATTGADGRAKVPPVSAVPVALPRLSRCCDAVTRDAARDGLVLRTVPGVAGGLTEARDATTGDLLADLPLATYHGQRLSAGRWLFVAPFRAIVLQTQQGG